MAIYPGTFDPMTHGHADIVQRAAALFDAVVVGVAENPVKQPRLDFAERLRLAKTVCTQYSNVRVEAYRNLLVEFAEQQQARVIIRGVRSGSDFDYEMQLAGINQQLAPTIDSVFLLPRPEYACISASFVHDIARCGGDVSAFVHDEVAQALVNHWQ